jgi:hypothetical protein
LVLDNFEHRKRRVSISVKEREEDVLDLPFAHRIALPTGGGVFSNGAVDLTDQGFMLLTVVFPSWLKRSGATGA